MQLSFDDIEELFGHTDSPTEAQKFRHEQINKAAANFAHIITEEIDNPAELIVLLRKIQDIRCAANVAVRLEAEGISYRGLFP